MVMLSSSVRSAREKYIIFKIYLNIFNLIYIIYTFFKNSNTINWGGGAILLQYILKIYYQT